MLRPRSFAAISPVVGKTRLEQFDYGQVELLDGPMLDQFRQNHTFFLNLSDDMMLKPFRVAAGQPAPGEDMGGWYTASPNFDPPRNMTGYIPGHTFGQYLSALARAYAVTGDKNTQAKVDRLVKGYAATISPKFWNDYCLPAYTSDKTTCGLIDAHQFAGQRDALAVLNHATDVVLPFLPPKALNRAEMAERPHPNVAWTWDESYTLPENFFLAYQRSGDVRYRELAIRFLQDDTYFNPLSEGKNVLPGEHAYSHLNALCSAVQAYLVTGSEKHLRAATNGFNFVLSTQSFATGGWGPNESFRKPDTDALAKSLEDTHASFETPCGAYGHFKMARYLMRITGDSTYGDSMEAILYNTVLGSLPIQEDGQSFYYSDYNNDAVKGFHPDKWPCCSGTLPQITADYGISSYFRAPGAVYVNLFVPSRVSWQQSGARYALEQRTQYPLVPVTTLRVLAPRPATFAVHLRVPAWAGPKTAVRVNGKPFASSLRPGTFLAIQREWKNSDTIEYTLDMPIALKAVDSKNPDNVALMQGPLTLFAVNDVHARFSRAQLLGASQKSQGSNEWLVASQRNGNITFKPFFAIQREHYRLYHQLAS
ncbi:glycoside hydrolase family 127 protein [Terriglobus aquaticus]|uniref:Glycoside hydrolase family 127 protein n=1 Tax=Terriglobus aquaticus TaxID=940139 RepID=A0ABW9KI35_9BACT|nr:glycoside hydrolase family 127 protein [Terriglobus aquaticus]